MALEPWEDPNHDHYHPGHRSGRICVERGCKEPAGNAWGPHWCFKHNVERFRRINAGMANLQAAFKKEKSDG